MKDIFDSMPTKPRIIQSDNGTEFAGTNEAFPDVKIIKSSPHLPQSNGMIERVHTFIKKYVGFAEKAKKLGYVLKQLERVVDLYNDRPHSITKVPPNELAKTNLAPKTLKEVKERIVKSSDKLTLQERKFP